MELLLVFAIILLGIISLLFFFGALTEIDDRKSFRLFGLSLFCMVSQMILGMAGTIFWG